MLNNLYDKVKKYIINNYKSLILIIVIYIVLLFPINCYIITGGGIMKVGNRITVEKEQKSKGSFNLAYVTETRATVATYLLSYVMPNWKRVNIDNYSYNNKESISDIDKRSNIDLLNVSSYAIKNAYEEANKTYTVTDKKLYVYYLEPDNKNKFKVGDIILKIDNTDIYNVEDLKRIISNHKENDTIKVLVKRGLKELELDVKPYESKNNIIIGVYINEVEEYKTYPKVKINFKKSESGPSGGLIETLDIYNKLVKKDITKGKKIAGTGEIDRDGNVITIGEAKYKLLGAVSKNADIFIVPNGQNYKECIKLKKERKLNIRIIGVSTVKEAIEKLNSI